MLLSLYDDISCDVINFKNFCEILSCFFKILATPQPRSMNTKTDKIIKKKNQIDKITKFSTHNVF